METPPDRVEGPRSRGVPRRVPEPPAAASALLNEYSRAVVQVAYAVAPAVVHLRVRRPGPSPAPDHEGVTGLGSAGSGVVFHHDGTVLTSAHIIERATTVLALFGDGSEHEATVVGMDIETDLAVLRIEPGKLPAARFGDSDALQLGEMVMFVGSSRSGEATVSTGVVTGLGRSVHTPAGRLIENLVETDAHLTPGSSGGAMVNTRGRVVGVNSASSERLHGVSFAVPSNTARWVARELIDEGRVERAYIGLAGQTVSIDPSVAEQFGTAATGVRIEAITAGGPAETAGLRRGDIVIRMGDRSLLTLGALQEALATLSSPGSPGSDGVDVVALRGPEIVRTVAEPTQAHLPGR